MSGKIKSQIYFNISAALDFSTATKLTKSLFLFCFVLIVEVILWREQLPVADEFHCCQAYSHANIFIINQFWYCLS